MPGEKHATPRSNSVPEPQDTQEEARNIATESTDPGTDVSKDSEDDGEIEAEPQTTPEAATQASAAPADATASEQPPLPEGDVPPPLPDEPAPEEDDGWQPVWDENAGAFYFYNRITQKSQWDNPRVPSSSAPAQPHNHDRIPPGTEGSQPNATPAAGGYNPTIHGDYDPNADYAIAARAAEEDPYAALHDAPNATSEEQYAATAQFNRFTGKFTNTAVHPTHTPDAHTDAAKSGRQMNAFFDVDAAANSHDGRSLRAERQSRKLSKKELQEFKEKRREKKEHKRRAWLRD